jgi:hypothetical protein
VAVYLVAALILFEIGAVISIFYLRAMVVPVNFELPIAARGVPAGAPQPGTSGFDNPALPAPDIHPTLPRLPNLPSLTMMPSIHPALLQLPAPNDKLGQIQNLNDQSDLFRRQNDLKSAMSALVRAEDLDPRNPDTLKNLAELWYLENDSVMAKRYWQRLVDLGPGVGTLYGVARDHVLLLDPMRDAATLTEPSLLDRTVYIESVAKSPVETVNGQPRLHVKTVLMLKDATAPFEQKELRPFVIFYQQMPDGSLAPDLAPHSGGFEDTFLFHGRSQESFAIDYVLPLPGTPGPNGKPQGEYYGFVIGIYYNNILRDAQSEPTDLVTRMPLPTEIQ